MVLLLVVSWSMLRGIEEGIVWAIVGGVGLDVFSAAPFGTMTIAMAATAYGVSQISRSLLRTNPLLPIAVTPFATVIFNFVMAALLEGFGWQINWPQTLTEVIGPLCIINSAVMVVVFAMLHGVNDRLEREISW